MVGLAAAIVNVIKIMDDITAINIYCYTCHMAGAVKKRRGFAGQRIIVLPGKIITDFLMKDFITRQLYITDIGYYPKAQHHYINRPKGTAGHIIIYCLEGSGRVMINDKRIEVLPSQCIVIPANTPHSYAANKDDAWTIYWVHFNGQLSGNIAQLINKQFTRQKPYITYSDNRIKLFEDIYTHLEKGYSPDTLRYVNMVFYHFLSSLLYDEKFNNAGGADKAGIVPQAIELMQKKLDAMLNLPQLAALVHLSPSHFSAVFKAQTGYAPIEYFHHLKIQRACQYLTFTNMHIKEIGASLGINDPYYFSRMFSKLMKMSPREYRNKNHDTAKP